MKAASPASHSRESKTPSAFNNHKSQPFFGPATVFAGRGIIQKKEPYFFSKPPENKTGLPQPLKAGIERLSGYSLDDVQVHFNSSKPDQLQARAYAQGTDIHLAAGQEKHLPHEAWHVVQQKQGRVKPTIQARGLPINDDRGLEREANRAGDKAQQTSFTHPHTTEPLTKAPIPGAAGKAGVVQRMLKVLLKGKTSGGLNEIGRPHTLTDDTPAILWQNMQPETQANAHSTLWFSYSLDGKEVLCKMDWVQGGFRAIHNAGKDAYYCDPKSEIKTNVGQIIATAKAHIAGLGESKNTLQGHCHAFAQSVYAKLAT